MSRPRHSALVLGAGSRGRAYADYALKCPQELSIVAVAEPDEARRETFARRYGVPASGCFSSWQDALDAGRIADAVFICTLDDMHTLPALRAMELGYDILLEKPMSSREDECRLIVEKAEETGVRMSVCHVLRYTPFFRTVKKCIDDGLVGDVAVVDLRENVCFWHQAHSFVRGNWRSSVLTSSMILQKSCHDMDILLYLLGVHCLRLSSFGSLGHFRPENAPHGSALRCLDCKVAAQCPYDAARVYLGDNVGWPVDVIGDDLSLEGRRKALQTGPYGRCVYHCDNDVVDRQTVNLEFEGGVLATFTMTGFTSDHTRELKVMGTRGQIVARMDSGLIEYTDFLGGGTRRIDMIDLHTDSFGHGGGDHLIVKEFLQSLDGTLKGVSSPATSLESHLMCFAAERSRMDGGRVVELV